MAIQKSVEYVELDVTSGNPTFGVNLTKGQDFSQCVPFFTSQNDSGASNDWDNRIAQIDFFDNAGTAAVRVTSGRSSATVQKIQVFVVEFDPSISVQQVPVSLPHLTGSLQVPITDVLDQTTAFLMYSYAATGGDLVTDVRANYLQLSFDGVSTTNALLQRRTSSGDLSGTLYVVRAPAGEFNVQHVDIDVASSSQQSATAVINIIEPDATFLLHTYECSETSTNPDDFVWVADLSNVSEVRIQRSTTPSATSTHTIQVVQALTGGWDVQRNPRLVLSSTSVNDGIVAIDQEKAFINVPGHSSQPGTFGFTVTTGGSQLNGMSAGADFAADNTVRFRKNSGAVTDDTHSYEVVQFSDIVPVAPDNHTPMPDANVTIGVPFGPFSIAVYWSGTPNPTFTATGLPNGLSIDAAGVISGTPTGGFQP